jgi:DNA repair exonuclease SbcCD ATPase subunit
MDGRCDSLREKLTGLIHEAATVKVELDRRDGKVRGVPHYSVIEEAAHELGQEVSRRVQALHMTELAAEQAATAACPTCGRHCPLELRERKVVSGDGPLPLSELVGRCPCCRRDFFPSAGTIGL